MREMCAVGSSGWDGGGGGHSISERRLWVGGNPQSLSYLLPTETPSTTSGQKHAFHFSLLLLPPNNFAVKYANYFTPVTAYLKLSTYLTRSSRSWHLLNKMIRRVSYVTHPAAPPPPDQLRIRNRVGSNWVDFPDVASAASVNFPISSFSAPSDFVQKMSNSRTKWELVSSADDVKKKGADRLVWRRFLCIPWDACVLPETSVIDLSGAVVAVRLHPAAHTDGTSLFGQ